MGQLSLVELSGQVTAQAKFLADFLADEPPLPSWLESKLAGQMATLLAELGRLGQEVARAHPADKERGRGDAKACRGSL